MSDAPTTPEVRIVCAICGMPDPQVTRGCGRPDCTWRAEAIADAIRSGAIYRVTRDGTNNSAEDMAEGRLNVNVKVWPKERGNA